MSDRRLGQSERAVGAASANQIVRVDGRGEVGRADGDIMCWERISLRSWSRFQHYQLIVPSYKDLVRSV